ILAGLRLARLVQRADNWWWPAVAYPSQVSRLHGYDSDSGQPYVLLDRYRGKPLSALVRPWLPDSLDRFRISLIQGLRWLAVAGIAHRNISPDTVRWDGQTAQITGFSQATVFGAPRSANPLSSWAPVEQRHGEGLVGDRDDIPAAAQLIYWV